MGLTMTEKILAARAGLDQVRPGQFLVVPVDLVSFHDAAAKLVIETFLKVGVDRVFDSAKVAICLRIYVPAKDIISATIHNRMREFAAQYGIERFYDIGETGIEHALFPEVGLVAPGEIWLNSDSHSPTLGAFGAFCAAMGWADVGVGLAIGKAWFRVPQSMRFELSGQLSGYATAKDTILTIIGRIGVDGAEYKAMEYCGPGLATLSMEQRMTLCNMTVEAGGKSAIMAVDETTRAYLRPRVDRPWTEYQSDPDAEYAERIEVDLSAIRPVVAKGVSPGDIAPAGEVTSGRVTEVFIGSCTNGRISDLREAAEVLRGRRVARGTRLIVIPASMQAYRAAIKEGLVEVFLEAGGTVSTPTCGPCPGASGGVLGADDVCVSTSNRNFPGRMGHPDARVYLASPYVAAASAVAGEVIDPRELRAGPAAKDTPGGRAGPAAKHTPGGPQPPGGADSAGRSAPPRRGL